MRFRIRTIMIAVVIVGLVTALVVLWWRARDEIRRARLEMEMVRAVAEDRARSAELQVKIAEARATSSELRALSAEREVEELRRKSSTVDGDKNTKQEPPTRRPSAAQ